MVEAAVPSLQPYFDRPFAFFGHSMGAVIAFEQARHLRSTRAIEPTRLFVSGHGAPQIPSEREQTYQLPDAEFVESLRRLNGTPEEVLSHPELLELMLPLATPIAYYVEPQGIIRGNIAVGLEQILRLLVAAAITALMDETQL